MIRTQAASCTFVFFLTTFSIPAAAQVQVGKLIPPSPVEYGSFGTSMDQDAERLIIGSNDERAFVYRRAGSAWTLETELTSPDPHAFDNYGAQVAIEGEWAAVAARFDDTAELDAGVVYLYRRDGITWSLDQTLVASAPKPGDRFGQAIDLDGGRLVVGASGDPDGGDEAGNAYIFEYVGFGWLQLAELAIAPTEFARYGGAVAIEGDWAIVGAEGDSEVAPAAGAAYAWRRTPTGWVFVDKMVANDGGPIHRFGVSVAISGSRAAIGAPNEDSQGVLSGAVYSFTLDSASVTFEGKLSGRPGSLFGAAVSLVGDDLWTGAVRSDAPLLHSGAVLHHRFDLGAWNEVREVWGSDTLTNDFFGNAISVEGERLLVAGPLHEAGAAGAGSLYEFDLGSFAASYCECVSEAPCGNAMDASGCSNSSGGGARMAWSGSGSGVLDDLQLSVTSAPAGVFGLTCAGRLQARTPLGDGFLCLDPAGGLQRLPLQVSGTDGTFAFGPGLVDQSQSWGGGAIAAGTTWNFQCWFRDVDGPCGNGSNLSNAVSVAFSL